MCSKNGLIISAGIVFVIIGFIMTMYGLFAKPFFSQSSWSYCDFCVEEHDRVLRNTRNCRIAGPFFIVAGIITFIVGFVRYKKEKNNIPGVVIQTTSTGNGYPQPGLQQPHKASGYPVQQQSYQQHSLVANSTQYPPTSSNVPLTGYTPQYGYPTPVGNPPQSGYPAPVGNPPQSGYPAPVGNPPQSGYPAPVGYPPQSGYPAPVGYPSQSGYSAPVGYPSQSGYPAPVGSGNYPAPPSYTEAVKSPSAPAVNAENY